MSKIVFKALSEIPHVYYNPELICFAPNPNEVTRPDNIATIVNILISLPIGPWTLSPSNG